MKELQFYKNLKRFNTKMLQDLIPGVIQQKYFFLGTVYVSAKISR